MKLLVVLTGGTISTVVENGVMGIHGDSPLLVIEKYRMECRKRGIKDGEITFDVIEPVRMLSECSQPVYLERIYYGILEKLGIAKDYRDLRKGGKVPAPSREELFYDGILLTHGSDTLSYSAAFFSEVFSWLSIPFVLTAADYPLSDARSNGMRNFSDAVDFIRLVKTAGVFVLWQNRIPGGNVFLASGLLEADAYRDCFSSFTGQAFGEVREGKLTIFGKGTAGLDKCKTSGPDSFSDHRKISDAEPVREGGSAGGRGENKGEKEKKWIPDLHMEWDVLFLRPYPGLRYDLISLEKKRVRAVVHYLYHSATACTRQEERTEGEGGFGVCGETYNLLEFARYCRELGIAVYLAGFKSADQALYETNDALLGSGLVKPLYGLSPEGAYMKVLVECNRSW